MALLSHLLAFQRNFLISKKKVDRTDLFNFGGQNMKENIKKFTGLTSTQPEMPQSNTFFFTFSLKKSQNYKFWKKNLRKSWIFDSGTVIQIVSDDTSSSKFTVCSCFIHQTLFWSLNRAWNALNPCSERCLALDFRAKVILKVGFLALVW